MTRSLFLCLLFVVSYRGQAQTQHSDTSIPQKLQLKKTELYKPAFTPNPASQHPSRKKDSVRSIMYVKSGSKDTTRYLIPPVQKKSKTDIKVTSGADRYLNQRHQ